MVKSCFLCKGFEGLKKSIACFTLASLVVCCCGAAAVPARAADANPVETSGSNFVVYAIQQASALQDNLTKRFSASGADGALDNFRAEAALALTIQGKSALIDVQAVLANAEAVPDASWGTLAKYLYMVADAPKTSAQQDVYNKQLQRLVANIGQDDDILVYSAVWALPLLATNCKEDVETISKLVKAIQSHQSYAGLIGAYGYDYETTAQAVYAMAVTSLNVDTSSIGSFDETLAAAQSALVLAQTSDGGFSYTPNGSSDVDTTGWVLTALSYAKTADLGLSVPSSSLESAFTYLVSKADKDLAGYKQVSPSNEYLTCGSAFMGICSYLKDRSSEVEAALHTVTDGNLQLSKTRFAFDGKTHAPAVTVSINGVYLAKLADYGWSIDPSPVYKVGTYTISITGKGQYSGTGSASYTIVPAKVTGVKCTAKKQRKLTVTWSTTLGKRGGVGGYKVVVKKGSAVIATKTIKKAGTGKKTIKLAKAYAKKKVKVTVTAFKGDLVGGSSATKTVKVKM